MGIIFSNGKCFYVEDFVQTNVFVWICTNHECVCLDSAQHKILTGENIDEFEEFSEIRQYFPYRNFPFSVKYKLSAYKQFSN